ncbi:MAG: zinc ribbon domain-containing protein [Gaiellales bacterium]|nr:MAG: zinc ribbon domain-containing protein [Gaiellales bacterium]
MAIYDLKCESCGHDFEKFVPGFLKEEHKQCPECDSRDVVQKFNSFSIGCSSSASGGSCAPPRSGGFG